MTQQPLPTIWHVSREYTGLAEAGGLKDVVYGLATSAHQSGYKVAVILPYYGFLSEIITPDSQPIWQEPLVLFSQVIQLSCFYITYQDIPIYLISSPYFANKKHVYSEKDAPSYLDEMVSNITLQKGVLFLAKYIGAPHLLHLHDGHTAWLPALIRQQPWSTLFANTQCLLTIHNAGGGYHQEIESLDLAIELTGLPAQVLLAASIYDRIDPLALAFLYATVNTVSPSFAHEIMDMSHDAMYGHLAQFCHKHHKTLLGIYNGINPDPYLVTQPNLSHIPVVFQSIHDTHARRQCKTLLSQWAHQDYTDDYVPYGTLHDTDNAIIFSFQNRVVSQKGIEPLVLAVQRLLMDRPLAQCVIMGQGEPHLEQLLCQLATHPQLHGRIIYYRGYHPVLAKLVVACSHFFLMPSVYEPCGLADLYAQTMGVLPIAHRTGGLEKIIHGSTGLLFAPLNADTLFTAMQNACDLFIYHHGRFVAMQQQAFDHVQQHFLWSKVFQTSYHQLYKQLCHT
jgi:starch synthase